MERFQPGCLFTRRHKNVGLFGGIRHTCSFVSIYDQSYNLRNFDSEQSRMYGSFSKNVHFSVRDDFFILPSAFDVIYFS